MKNLFFCFAILCITACASDDENTTETAEEMVAVDVGFFNLKVGNKWIYEYFVREHINDPLSNFISTGTIEEREVIERSSVDNEIVYTIEARSSFGELDFLSEFDEEVETYQVKDSLGYLVRINEGIQFSSQNEEEFVKSTLGIGDILGVLLPDMENIETPAGDFNCTVNEFFVGPDGVDPPGKEQSLMVDGIGEVFYRISFVHNPLHSGERRLISFDFPE